MENLIVIIIIGIAAFFVGRNFYQKFNKKNTSCNCECSSCSTEVSSCELPEAKEHMLTGTNSKSSK
jgi:hypothetical protein